LAAALPGLLPILKDYGDSTAGFRLAVKLMLVPQLVSRDQNASEVSFGLAKTQIALASISLASIIPTPEAATS
jgi:hypothetical protein